VLLIAGGRSKGGDVAGFVHRIAPRLRQAFVIGETSDALARHLRDQAVPVWSCGSLREATERALEEAADGDHILLSPAFASFDMFNGYDDRGRRFEAIVAELGAASCVQTNLSLKPSTDRFISPGLLLL
jgi:UDP-N-acetylmuramoylalanine--D-glutamate ligase